MVGKLLRCLLLLCVFEIVGPEVASAGLALDFGPHRADVDVTRYPWSSIGKLYNETGAACSGVVIAADKVLTAAHCLFNYRSLRFIPADALHFLVGYRTGRYAVHARVASYEVGAGFDPLRYGATSSADWAVLTTTKSMPVEIGPLKLSDTPVPRGTRAILVGYPQDRAHAMTADRDCELRDEFDGGRFLLHTCRSTKGYSGAPILVNGRGNEVRIAGIQIAARKNGETEDAIAVPAQAIGRQARNKPGESLALRMTASTGTTASHDNAQIGALPEEALRAHDTVGAWDETGFEIAANSLNFMPSDDLTGNEVALLGHGLFSIMTP